MGNIANLRKNRANMTTEAKLRTVALYAQPGMNDFVFNIPFCLFQSSFRSSPLFRLRVFSDNGQDVATHLGARIPVHGGLSSMDRADVIVISGWRDVDEAPSSEFNRHLRKAAKRGAQIVALCYGTYAVAYAGLLDGKNAATHWMAENDFRQRFPKIMLDDNRLYVEDGNILTSAGAAGGLDCCLHLLRRMHGVTVANEVARTFVTAPHREGGQAQFIRQPATRHTRDDRINSLLVFLRQDLGSPHRLDDLAKRLNMSRRTFSRHFSRATGMALGEWLQTERLWQAQNLLENGDMPIEHVAEKAGFGSATNLRVQFRQRFHVSPSVWRRMFRSGS